MKTRGSNDVDTGVVPRTLTKKALRSYFGLTYKRFRTKLITDELRLKLGITSSDQDKAIQEYDFHQTRILIQELDLSKEELIEIGKFQ